MLLALVNNTTFTLNAEELQYAMNNPSLGLPASNLHTKYNLSAPSGISHHTTTPETHLSNTKLSEIQMLYPHQQHLLPPPHISHGEFKPHDPHHKDKSMLFPFLFLILIAVIAGLVWKRIGHKVVGGKNKKKGASYTVMDESESRYKDFEEKGFRLGGLWEMGRSREMGIGKGKKNVKGGVLPYYVD